MLVTPGVNVSDPSITAGSIVPAIVIAQVTEEEEDKTLSPYFLVMSEDTTLDLSKYTDGWHEISMTLPGNANNVAGIYFARLKIGDEFVSSLPLNYIVK